MNGTQVILEPSSFKSSVANLVPANIPTISVSNNSANAAATAAAIALTNLQNNPSVVSATSVPIQPTVIVQAPNSTVTSAITDSVLPRVVLCSSVGGKPVTLTPVVTFPKSETSQETINSTNSKVSSTISSAPSSTNLIKRPIDLLTSAAIAAAAASVNNEAVSTLASSNKELNSVTVLSDTSLSMSRNESSAATIVNASSSSKNLQQTTFSNDKSIGYNLSKFLVYPSNSTATLVADDKNLAAKRLLPDCNANVEIEEEQTKRLKTQLTPQ